MQQSNSLVTVKIQVTYHKQERKKPMELKETFQQVKAASKTLGLLTDDQRNEILQAVADAIIAETPALLAANAEDLAKMDKANPLYDRLQLTEQRLQDIASDMRHVSTLPSPLGRVLKDKTLDNGLHLQRVAVPFGVIGMIYEARPNVTYDVFSLCFKSGNACVLKGGKDADASNTAGVELIHRVLKTFGINPNVVTLLPATHEATGEMLNAVGYIDLCIPRGGKKLIQFVRDTAKVPVRSRCGTLLFRQGRRHRDGQTNRHQCQVPKGKCMQCPRLSAHSRKPFERPSNAVRRTCQT